MIKYVNNKIIKLHEKKSNLVTKLKRLKRKANPNSVEVITQTTFLSSKIEELKYEIQKEFSKACNRYWANKGALIDYKNTDTFFPDINRMFRPKDHTTTQHITIDNNNVDLLNRIQVNPDNQGNHTVLNQQHDILNAFLVLTTRQ